MTDRPLRVEGIEINPIPEGYVVYDPERDRVHELNHTAALVLELCNGENTSEDIVRVLQTVYELGEPPESGARECIDQLRAEGLVV
ncbi:MAG TPA: PqqD family protein [Candidatus Sulfotelmatobacter sp.]|jgi:hypothetical protein|nr:PqqD family protein [Candidatus Sulfotelmatobacter sp.]